MSIAALAGAASARPGVAGQSVDPSYGLGFRFTVRIDAVADLGAWQSCSGLKVEFKSTEVRRGGSYLIQERLPDKIFYPRVVLKRAVLPSSSSKVQDWLAKAARSWMTEADPKATGTSATITLYDSNDSAVLTWILKSVRPAAWSGPELDAKSSQVALETLELEHEGFEVTAPGAPSRSPGASGGNPELPEPKPAPFILRDEETGTEVEFRFPPQRIAIEVKDKDVPGVAVATADQGTSGVIPGAINYKVQDLILSGPKTFDDVARLAYWATATPKSTGGSNEPAPAPAGSNKPPSSGGDTEQPVVTLNWGPKFKQTVQIQHVSSTFERFTADGIPIRATVGLTLTKYEEDSNGGANPTSGGIAGRASHVLTQTDTLPLLARQHYGNPGAWRDIAAANEIDDPLRTRPGRLLYLPAGSELAEGNMS